MYYAFISYQTEDRLIAGRLQHILENVGIRSFLAHEDIEVSEEWRIRILEEIGKADIFICVLTKNYLKSQWCTQESGIAAFRKDLTVIPLSADGTIPQAFLGNIQAAKIDPETVSIRDLIPGFLRRDFGKGISILIEQIRGARNYRGAEGEFRFILPYLERMAPDQGKLLLQAAIENNQVHHASDCAKDYIPRVLKLFGKTIPKKERDFLVETCRRYGADI